VALIWFPGQRQGSLLSLNELIIGFSISHLVYILYRPDGCYKDTAPMGLPFIKYFICYKDIAPMGLVYFVIIYFSVYCLYFHQNISIGKAM
jgi:hypothetical protein